MGSFATRPGRSPALFKFDFDSLSPVVPSLREALQPFSAVIVTGGSSGIGKSFIQLGEKLKPDLVFCNLSRRPPPENIFPNSRKKLNHFGCDLSRAADIERIAPEVHAFLARDVPAGRILLINNSGFGAFGTVAELPLDRQLEMIDLNIRGLVHLSGLCLPLLQTRGGAMINVASTLGYMPAPFVATYAASKAFVLHWSIALNEELRGTNVRVLTVSPGTTRTEFFRLAGSRTDAGARGMDPETVARQALTALARGSDHIVTGWGNKAYTVASTHMPKTVSARIVGRIMARRRSAAPLP